MASPSLLVILPGLDGTGKLFEPLKKALPPGWKTAVVSYPRDRGLGLPALERHVRGQLPKREAFVMVAESFGGLVAARIAGNPPPNMKALVLSASFVTPPAPKAMLLAKPVVLKMLRQDRLPQPLMHYVLAKYPCSQAYQRFLEKTLLSVEPNVIMARLRQALSTDERTYLQRSSLPLLYLSARRDRVVRSGALKDIQKIRPDVRVMSIDAPHFLLQLAPGPAVQAIRVFIDEFCSKSSSDVPSPTGRRWVAAASRMRRPLMLTAPAGASPALRAPSPIGERGRPRRILIATATAGGGHLQAAAALEEAWRLLRPEDTVERVDTLEFTPKFYRKAYAEGYVRLAEKAPELYAHAFRKTDDPKRVQQWTQFRRWSARLVAGRFLKHVKKFAPDILLAPHFLPLEAIGYLKEKRPLVVCIVTDFEAHALWMEPAVDLYCVATEATKARLVARGVPPKRVIATGIPVSQRFLKSVDIQKIRRDHRLNARTPTLLVLGGGMGMGPLEETLREIEKAQNRLQILVVAGRNEALRQALIRQPHRQTTRILGFVTNMEELMAASDLIVSKPGGLTTSEALAIGKPLLIVNPLPGQEAANSDFLLEHGAAIKVNRLEDLPFRLDQLLSSHQLGAMARAAKRLGRPRAAEAICKTVLQRLA